MVQFDSQTGNSNSSDKRQVCPHWAIWPSAICHTSPILSINHINPTGFLWVGGRLRVEQEGNLWRGWRRDKKRGWRWWEMKEETDKEKRRCIRRWAKEMERDGKMYRVRKGRDKQRMIGCQAADKKHKVNVKLRDHNTRTCPLFYLLPFISPALCDFSMSASFCHFTAATFSHLSSKKNFCSFFGNHLFPAYTPSPTVSVTRHSITAGSSVCASECVCTSRHVWRLTAERHKIPAEQCSSMNWNALLSKAF